MTKLLVVTMHVHILLLCLHRDRCHQDPEVERGMDPGCVLNGFRVPVQGPVRGERPMHATGVLQFIGG
jgi:hypothetical protein